MMLQRTTDRLLATYAIGKSSPGDAIQWATAIPAEGQDTQHLRVLAGYSELQTKAAPGGFALASGGHWKSSGWNCLRTERPMKAYACLICEETLEGVLPLREAHRALHGIWQEANCGIGAAETFGPLVYLADSLSLVEEGYAPLLERFVGLDPETYPGILRSEAHSFIDAYRRRRQNTGTHSNG